MPQPMRYAHQEHLPTFNVPTLPSQAPRTSRSPPSFNVDHFISPVKMGTQIYDAYASIPSSASRAREAYATSFQSSGNFQTRQMMAQDPNHNHQPENPVARFLLEESSWDPLMGRQHSALLNMGPLSEYTTYRNTTAPSEADTVGPVTMVSDSGYGSMPRQSVGIPSVYGDMDQCAETQSLIRGVSDFQFHGLSPGSATPPKEEPEGNAWSHHEATSNPDSNDLICPTCKALVKTKSEIKKHEQRHSKPHRCDMEKCPRNGDGFSTLNDLARHKQTVHKVGGIKYRCNMGPCAIKLKDWPRADNFKQHLVRVHSYQPDNLEEFIYRPDEPVKPLSSDSSEALPPQPPVEAHLSSVSVPQPGWEQTDIISPPTDLAEEAETDQSDNAVELSDGAPSIDGSSLDDVDEGQYRIPIPFDGMGLDQNMGHMMPQFDMTSQQFHGLSDTSSEQMMDTVPTCINPDILNHMGLRTSFPGEQAGARDMRSQILELEPEGQLMFSQGEQETEIREDDHSFPSSHQMTEDLSQDGAVEGDNDTNADDSGGSVSAEQSFSPPEIPEDVIQPPKTEPFKPEPHTAASTPDSMNPNLDEMDANELEAKHTSVVEDLMREKKLNEILKKLGYRMVKDSDVKDTKDTSSSESQTGTNAPRHGCDRCTKTFHRACELRKHRKRHDKPYACTYAQCDKRFGSKNDWKRHENSQHFQLECWKCNEKSKDNEQEVCGKVCHRRETFTNHLEKDHGLDQLTIEGKWATCRVGRNCETRFWCGFCKAVVELEGRGGLAWTERFNHIDEHFNGRNGKPKVDISEWKSVESEPLEALDFMQTGKPQERDYRGRYGSAEQSRKRHRSESGDRLSVFRRKRIRLEDGEVFWSCCSCHNVWSPATTGNTCMDCSHTHCDECTLEAHSITEDASTTLMP